MFSLTKARTILVFAAKASILLALLGATIAVSLFFIYTKDLPRPERITEEAMAAPTQIYDNTGTVLLYELYQDEQRNLVTLSGVPSFLAHAIIAAEDDQFYEHWGFDLGGIVRAMFRNLKQGRLGQGGSTITQQLVRTVFLSREKTVERKIKEAVITIELERRYSKDEILEFYLNQVPLGMNVYGVGAASTSYFGKEPSDITLEEAATLAAMIQAPSYYSPYGEHRAQLFERKNWVLDRMAAEHYITTEEATAAKEKEIVFQDFSPENIKAPHFVLYVLDQLFERYGEEFVRKSGFNVYTSLDWELQKLAEKAVQDYAARNALLNAHNAALVSLNPQTGEIVAMVGSKDWHAEESYPKNCVPGETCLFDPKVNVALAQPGRQPGSAFKPFVYATAFLRGANDETIVIDEETNFGIWGGKEYIPQNYDGKFRGEVTLRSALAQSLNIPAIKVLVDMAGIEDSISTAKQMGITTLNRPLSAYGPSLVLGGGEVRLLDMVSSYGVFAMDGKRTPPLSIIKIESKDGERIEQNNNTPATVLQPKAAELITSILSDNEARAPMFGQNSMLYFKDYPVAVKTGTTQEYRDAWTIGYLPYRNPQHLLPLVGGVWVGNSNNDPMSPQPSVVLAGPIWRSYMQGALEYLKNTAPTAESASPRTKTLLGS